MGFCQQYTALMRKNFILKRRMLCTTLFEILLPVTTLVVLVGIRQAVQVQNNDPDLHLDERRYIAPTLGIESLATYNFDTTSSIDVVAANTIRGLVYKVIRRGHVIAVSPNTYPFCDGAQVANTSDSFSANLARYIEETADMFDLELRGAHKDSCSGSWYIRGFSSGDSMDGYAQNSDYPKDGYLEGGVDFSSFTSSGLSYTIRMNSSTGTSFAFEQQIPNSFAPPTDDLSVGFNTHYWNMLLLWGFVPFQNYIESWGIGRISGNMSLAQSDNAYGFAPFPTPQYREDDFDGYVSGLLPILFTLTFIWPVTRLVKQFVEEKELRIKEGMRVMGMGNLAHFLSWFTTYVLIFLVMSLLIILITWSGRVYVYSNLFLIFLYFFIFSLCVFAFCWLVASFFSKATVGATIGAVLFLAAFLGSFGLNEATTRGEKVLACLSAPICFGQGAQQISLFESAQQGVTFRNLNTEQNNFTFGTCIGMLFFDFFLYIVLALYAERIIPSEWGVSLPCCFCFLPSYWCPRPPQEDSQPRTFDERYERCEDVQATVGVAIRNLEKRFGNQTSEEAAVKGINLDMYEGQILALLGHNGAGKTTTINMLTGMLQPTSGDALIYGYNINGDMPTIRQNLGVCPQHNILYDYLTVTEHLVLFARLKGVPESEIPGKVTQIIEEVGLTEKVRTYSKNLSGGMKRKLSVAIALIGGSTTVILDEPTSGMDPYSRRSTWEMLKQAKGGRVLVLTTHFMDEADQLGDRIAIMHRGVIKCCGSSLFLKSRYGVGYTLTIDKQGDNSDGKAIQTCIKSHVASCKLLSDVAGEVSFQLPFRESSKFPDMFDALEKNKKAWGINSYGISVTTLEEVFLKVGHEADEEVPVEVRRRISSRMRGESVDEGKNGGPSGRESLEASNPNGDVKVAAGSKAENDSGNELGKPLLTDHDNGDDVKLTNLHLAAEGGVKIKEEGLGRAWNHFRALLAKRWHNAKRDRKVWLWQFLYPALWLIGGIGLLQFAASLRGKSVTISAADYNSPNYVPVNPPSFFGAKVLESGNNAVLINATTPAGSELLDSGCQFTDVPPKNLDDMSRYLLCTWDEFEQSKYGAYILDQPINLATFSGQNLTVTNTIYVNTTTTYGSAVYLSLLNEAKGREFSPGFNIELKVKDWPLTKQQQTLNEGLTSIIVAIAFAFIPASVVGFIVMERETKSKHLQIISGVSVLGYWCANLFWDFVNFLPPCLFALVVFKIYDIESLTGEAAGVLFMVSLLYALSVITFTYCVSFLFKNASTAQSIMLMVYIFTGCILLIASIIMSIIPSTQDVNDKMKYLYRLVPSFSFGESVINLMTRDSVIIYGASREPTDWVIVGRPCVYLVCEFVAYSIALMVIEQVLANPSWYSIFYKAIGPNEVQDPPFEDDPDVIAEKERIERGDKLFKDAQSDSITVKGLRKVYPGQDRPKVAVKDLWFGIPEGQCFGFLGINGAGKSSTLKMLTGDTLPTRGTAELAGLDVLSRQQDVRKLIGYCPQFDALLPNMTARETLRMFARFKGISSESIEAYVEALCKQLSLDINGWLDKPCGGYSGGNKRKLSVGIALVGNPPIVFLDEPSTGMDPGSRRFMWDLISGTMANRSVILTTHSMEECEALCARLGIMVGGRLRCIGSSQRVKFRYGSGYQLDVKVAKGCADKFKTWLNGEIKETKLLEDQSENMKFRINPPKDQFTLSKIFRLIERNRKTIGILEYSVSETTLEQIFIHFAKQQEEERGAVAGFSDNRNNAYNPPRNGSLNHEEGDHKEVDDEL